MLLQIILYNSAPSLLPQLKFKLKHRIKIQKAYSVQFRIMPRLLIWFPGYFLSESCLISEKKQYIYLKSVSTSRVFNKKVFIG